MIRLMLAGLTAAVLLGGDFAGTAGGLGAG